MFKYLKNKDQKGYALITVIVVMVVLIILGTSLLSIALADTKMAIYQENSMKSYYIARSGAYTLADYIINNPAEVFQLVSAGESSQVDVADGSFKLEVTQSGSEIIIKSIGDVRGVRQEVSAVLAMSPGAIFDFAVAAKEKIHLHNHVTVIGGVVTNGTADQVTTQPNSDPQKESIQTEAQLIFPDIVIPEHFDQVISTPITGTYNIDVIGETHLRVEEGIIMQNNADRLNIQGSGELHLYVSNNFYTKNHAIIDISSNVVVFVYILDSSNVEIRSDTFRGIIYAPNSEVKVKTASQDREIVGTIVGNDVEIEGNHTTISYSDGINLDNIQLVKTYKIKEWR